MVLYKDKIIAAYVLAAIITTVPTWFSDRYETEKLSWFVWDMSHVIRISLLPLMAAILVENKILKRVFYLYFFLTLTNVYSTIDNYLGQDTPGMMMMKLILACLLVIYLMIKLWKHEGAFRE